MKFLNLAFLSVLAANAIFPPVKFTENDELVKSLDLAIQKHLKKNNGTKFDDHVPSEVSTSKAPAPVAKITNEAEARGFIKYAGAAYCGKNSVLNWNCANCNEYAAGASEAVYFSDEDTNTAGYLAVNKGKQLIVMGFRGSKNIENWLHNIDISFTSAGLSSPFQDAKYHTGFITMTNALYSASSDAIKKALAKYPNYKVVFTGHSLGGALATLTAFKLAQAGIVSWNKINLLSYGQPRVGNPKFAQFLNTKPWTSTRVTAYADLVAISPGRTFGYEHSQYNMHIDEDGKTVKCSIYEEDENCISDHIIPSIDAHFTFWNQRMNSKC